jgi:hypothetical protein
MTTTKTKSTRSKMVPTQKESQQQHQQKQQQTEASTSTTPSSSSTSTNNNNSNNNNNNNSNNINNSNSNNNNKSSSTLLLPDASPAIDHHLQQFPRDAHHPITVLAKHRLKAGSEADFFEWVDEITAFQSLYSPGFQGSEVIRPYTSYGSTTTTTTTTAAAAGDNEYIFDFSIRYLRTLI